MPQAPLTTAARRRLRALSLLMLAASMFTAIVAVAAGYRSWLQGLEREEAFLRNTTASLIAIIDRRLEPIDGMLASLSHGDGSADETLHRGGRVLDAMLDRLRGLGLAVESLGVADAAGTLVALSPATASMADNSAMAAQALAHYSRPDAAATPITPGIRLGSDQRIVFVVSRALRDAGSKLTGVSFAALPIDDLVATVAEQIGREGGRVTILNGAYHVIARLPRAGLGADLSKTPISLAIKNSNGAGIMRARSTIDGLELLTSFASSPHYPVHVVKSVDLPTIRARWFAEQQLDFLLLGLLFAGTLFSNVALHRAMRRQMVAEHALRTSDQLRYQRGLEGARDGLAIWDAGGSLVVWNQRFDNLVADFGGDPRPGMTYRDLLLGAAAGSRTDGSAGLQPDLVERALRAHDRADETPSEIAPRSSRILEVAHRRAAEGDIVTTLRDVTAERGRRRERLGAATTFRSGAGRVIEAVDRPTADGGLVSIYRDITDQSRLLDQLQTTEADLRRALTAEHDMNERHRGFVAMASHEFRTPLAIIDSAAQRLLSSNVVPNETTNHKRLHRIRESVTRMTEIIDRTLATARLDEGRIEFTAESFDLVALASEVARRQLTITPSYRIETIFAASSLVIEADRRLIDHVISNLLSNAVKYAPMIRRAELRIEADGDDVVIAVADQGVGIPADEIDRLFTRFFRASTATGIVGTGIGLHLVRAFVAMHGGRIDVRSELGRGSVFTVRLPRRIAIKAAA